ncbi:MAG: hypothetical protein AAGB24_02400 [Bacteroidota bacterium]
MRILIVYKKAVKLRQWILCLLGWLTVACTSDDGTAPIDDQNTTPDFRVIGEDFDTVYQYNYEGEAEVGELVNLSDALNIDPNYLTLRQIDGLISFFSLSFVDGMFSLAQKNLETTNTMVYEDFYANTSSRSIVWGTNDGANVFFGYYGPFGSTNLSLHDIDLSDLSGQDLLLEFGIQDLYEPLYFNEKLFITYKDGGSKYKVVVYDTQTQLIVWTLDFGDFTPSIFIDDGGNLSVLKKRAGEDLILETYDFDTLRCINKHTLQLDQIFDSGVFDGFFVNGELLYWATYVQPAPIAYGPAIYDVATGQHQQVDLIGIVEQVQQDLNPDSIEITAQGYSVSQSIFLVGYTVRSALQNSVSGGVLTLSKTGELLSNVEVPFAPTYFIRD